MAAEDGKQEMLVFAELLDSVIVDVAAESHRAARLGLDRRFDTKEEEEFRASMEARSMLADPSSSNSGENNSKHTVDIFGQTHPAIAGEIFNCMNCGRPIVAGRFAPHLEKCMGKHHNRPKFRLRPVPQAAHFPGGRLKCKPLLTSTFPVFPAR